MKKKMNAKFKTLKKLPLWFKAQWKKIVVIVGVVGLLWYFKGFLVVSWVNNQPVTRWAFTQELQKQAGRQVLDTLVIKELISQEAKKQNVKITDEAIQEQIKGLEDMAKEQEAELDDLLEAQGMTRNELIEEIKLQKTLEALVGKDIEVTDDEVNQYIETNKDYLGEEEVTDELISNVREQLKQQKLSQKAQDLIGELQLNAKIVNWL